MELDGRVAIVTGGGSGLGAAAARRLAAAGAAVALVGRTESELHEVADGITARGGKALALVADVSREDELRAAFDAAHEQFGRLDVLFANAGINGVWAPIDELAPEEWDKTIAINLRSTYLSLHFAVPLMRERGGSIIITSSINGTRTFTTAGASAYATSKAGQLALGQMAALELARYRIRVNVVCPGAIGTEIDDNTEARNVDEAKVPAEFPEGTVPLTKGRSGEAGDVAELVLFLASDRSKHISGTPVWIDGAQSLLV